MSRAPYDSAAGNAGRLRDCHARELQKHHISRELARAWERAAMVKGDRRDSYLMSRATYDRRLGLRPQHRAELALSELATYDRARERAKLSLADGRTLVCSACGTREAFGQVPPSRLFKGGATIAAPG